MPSLHIGYLAVGSRDVKDQALYAVLSAIGWRSSDDVALHVYTDDARHFDRVAAVADVVHLGPERVAAWRGPSDTVFRMKPSLIADLAQRFPESAVGLVDADTWSLAPPDGLLDRVGPGRAVMHLREYHVMQHPTGQLRRFRRRVSRARFYGQPIDLDHWMWNSGVVVLDPRDTAILAPWTDFIDAAFPRYPKPITEQYGVSMLLQQRGAEISACDDLVFHYWPRKPETLERIRADLDATSTLTALETAAYVRSHPISLPPPVETKRERPGFWARLLGRRNGSSL